MKESFIRIYRMQKSNIKGFGLSTCQLFMGAILVFLFPCIVKGEITYQVWTEVGGSSILNLRGNSHFPSMPDIQSTLTSFDAPFNWSDIYGTRIVGYIIPPVTGNYTFWIASDDQGELWLSTDSNPDNTILIASVPNATSRYQWDKYSDQRSSIINLQAGQLYFIEALQKEEGGNDHLSAAWEGPTIAKNVINGIYLSPLNGAEEYKPIATNDFLGTTVNKSLKCCVLNNDKDANQNDLSVYSWDVTSLMGGTVVYNVDGTLQYDPPSGFSGFDSFYYTISDGTGRYDTAYVSIAVNEVIDCNMTRMELLAGVNQITTRGTPSDISIFGEQALGLIHNGQYHPMIGAATLGKGRVVAFGHSDYVDFSSAQDGYDTGTLYLNVTEWVSPLSGTDIYIITNKLGTQTWLQSSIVSIK